MLRTSIVSSILAITSLFCTPALEAGGWGKSDKVATYENVSWNEVYFDMNDVKFTGYVPNYSGASLQNSSISITGAVDNGGYLIQTAFSQTYTPPKSAKDFLKVIKDSNPGFKAVSVDGKALNAKYVVDITPTKKSDTDYWRFICTNNRIIKLGTEDANANRRNYFFNSIRVQ